MTSKMIWGSVESGRGKTKKRRRALKIADTGIVYEPVGRATGMHQPVTDPKVAATFLSTDELRAELAAQESNAEPVEATG